MKENERVSVYRLPSDPEERKRWMKAIPRDNIPDKPDTVVCAKHFPPNFPVVKVKGRERPKDPPSIFENLPKSLLPTPPPPKRLTTKATSSSRRLSSEKDELSIFLEADKISSFQSICDILSKDRLDGVIYYVCGDCIYIQSKEMCESKCGIPKYLLKISSNLSYEAYHTGVQCHIQTLTKNRIHIFNHWSQIEEAVRYLNTLDIDNKKSVLLQQVDAMSRMNSSKKQSYPPEVIVRAFEYFARSRSLYQQLRNDFQLPSVSTLTKITSKVSNIDDITFMKGVFDNINDGQKSCILLLDEVYVKPMLTYHGGNIFGHAVNDSSSLAKTVLAFMVVCLYGGPKFLVKMLPVSKLDSDFLFEQSNVLIDKIKDAGGKVVSIICDNNRVNQAFYKKFSCTYPWRTDNDIFLLFDFVHIVKSIRNNWITERNGEIEYEYRGDRYTAKWEHIKTLQKLEDKDIVKMSRLNFVAANPKPIERQKVETCLRVFCEETINALKCHTGMQNENVDGTVIFLTKVVQFWKTVNVKSPSEGIRLKDSLRDPISSNNDFRLDDLIEFSEMMNKLTFIQGKRVKCLTKDTSNALHHTCQGLVDLSKYLLQSSHSYILLGNFTTDPLEKAFGKLRQGSGGTYFINIQQIMEKWNINKAKLILQKATEEPCFNDAICGHYCDKCNYKMTEEHCELFDNLNELEKNLTDDVKESLVYIAGYVCRKDDTDECDTFAYYDRYGIYTSMLDRGGLKIPGDTICQWVFLSYILFHEIDVNYICRVSLSQLLLDIALRYEWKSIEIKHGVILANIFLNNYCHLYSPVSSSEPKVKVLKLSN